MSGSTFIRGADGVLTQPPGYEALWGWFGLSRAAWLTLPRSMMHEMPDDWQAKMAELLDQFNETYTNVPEFQVHVSLRKGGKYCSIPEVIGNYRYPDVEAIEAMKGDR